jgi:hypothetical protein
MKTLVVAGLALITLKAHAHSDHDWRHDIMAYLSIEQETVVKLKKPFLVRGHQRATGAILVDMDFFKSKLEILTGVKPYQGKLITERKSQASLDTARSFLAEEYQKLGFITSTQPFGKGTNFIAEKKGSKNPEKILVLSSHIDSVKNRGANDNGSGTIGLLTVAQELAKADLGITVRILGFDLEEVGLKGSDAYVATIEDEDIIGNINFEMMGVNTRDDGAFHIIDCDRGDSLFLTRVIKDSIGSLGLGLSVVKACTDRSDHASFWRRGIPAVVISENFFGGDADPCYHARCDVMDDRLNYPYMGRILTAVLDATKKLAK